MRVSVFCVGRARAPLAPSIEEYQRRVARYWALDIVEVREESARATAAPLVRRREGERILDRFTSDLRLLTCDPAGVAWTSEEFAEFLREERDAARNVGFAIGGAFGLDEAVKRRAARSIALAPWTLSHELARLVLMEQLYRAGTILRGEPYHK